MTTITKRFQLAVRTLAVIGSFAVLQAAPIDAIYAFGDSLTDVGNIYAASGGTTPVAPYVAGQFTNGNVWVQDLASGLGLSALKASLLGGTDYAYGTAETGAASFNTSAVSTDLVGPSGQLAQFQAAHGTADPNALYAIWIGSNDLNDILANASPAQFSADAAIVIGNIDSAVNTLAGMGAKKILILTVPDLGKTPAALALGPVASGGASALSAAFDTGLTQSLFGVAAADSINVSVLDTYALLDSIAASPGSYGLNNVTQPCLTGEVNYSGGTPCSTPDQYLFWDPLHPTAAGHQIVAGEALDVLTPEPGSMLLCAIGCSAFLLAFRKDCSRKTC